MADQTSTAIFVINVVGRPVAEVIPDTNIKTKPWNGPESAKDGQYFSDLCELTCTEETKRTITNHMSLWNHIINNFDSMPSYICILEDDNSITNPGFINNLDSIITELEKNNVDILQLITHNRIFKDRLSRHITVLHDLAIYKGSIDMALSAYIIKKEVLKKIYAFFMNNKPSIGISLEFIKAERALSINRYVMDNNNYIHHDYHLKNVRRTHQKFQNSYKARLDNWIMMTHPAFHNSIYTPLFSFFGTYDVTLLAIFSIALIIVFIIFDIQNKILWLMSGIFVAYAW